MNLKKHRIPYWPPMVAAFCAVVTPLSAQDAAEIVNNVRAALGIDAFEKSDQAVRLSGPLEFAELKGTYTLVFDAAGRFHRTYDARITTETIFDGKTVRARDIGGEVGDEGLGDRTGSLFDAWATTGLWFSRERCKDLVLDPKAGDEKTVVLKTDLDEGRVVARVTIDRKTWRPLRWVFDEPASKSTMEWEGETRAGPLRLPRKITGTTENGGRTIAEFAKVQLVPPPDWSAELAALKSPDDADFDAKAIPALEVKRAPTGHLLVHPQVNGKDVGWFIFDTGAGTNVLDQRIVRDAKLETFGSVPAVGAGGATTATFCQPESLQLGPMALHKPLAAVMDFAFLDPFMGVKIAGIIGYGTLARCIVEFDLTGGTIRIFDPATYQHSGAPWTPLILYDRVPSVPGRFEDHDAVFRLDTGTSGGVTFHAPTVERLNLLKGRKTSMSMFGGVGGMKTTPGGTVKWLEFGGKRHKKVEATFATEMVGAFADPYIDANVGGDVLGKSVMVIDYPHSRIAFKWKAKNKKGAAADKSASQGTASD